MISDQPVSLISLFAKLGLTFGAAEKSAIERLPSHNSSVPRNHIIVHEGDRPDRCCFIRSGLTCWFKIGREGTRQLLGLNMAGDMPDLQSLHLEVMDAGLSTLSPCSLAFYRHDDVLRLIEDFPRIGAAFWRSSMIDAAIFREWVMNTGGRNGISRIAHLLCEVFHRQEHMGLTRGNICDFTLTQGEIGEATGLSTVHVNRMLQTLRTRRLIVLSGTELVVIDREGLQALAEFDPTYLHLH